MRASLYWAGGVLLLLGAGCDDQEESGDTASARPVAQLSSASGEVSRRAAGTVAWEDASKGTKLFNRDAVKTGEGARAVVSFIGRELQLEIEERSLVIIEPPPTKPTPAAKKTGDRKPAAPRVARVEKGTVRGIVKPGAAPLKVLTPQGEAEIRAEGKEAVPFRLRLRKGGKLEVAVLKGRARVRSGTSEVTVKPRQVVDVTREEISAPVELLPYPVLVAPPVDDRVAAGTEMELRWTPVPGAAVYRVQVSTSVSFDRRLYDTSVLTPFFKLPAPEAKQTYVWRVASVDKGGRESEFGYARRFHVETVEQPEVGQLLHPPDNTALQLVIGKRSPVLFRWKGEADRFELVVARVPDLKHGVVSRRRLRETEEVLSSLTRGTFYWGVYGLDEGKRVPLFTKAHKLVIKRRRPPYVRVPKKIQWK